MKTILVLFIKYSSFLMAVIIAVVAIASLFNAGLPPTHDGEYHVVRFYEFDRALRSGDWYPVWAASLNYTYGVPLFNYVYPLPNYAASIFHLLGASFISAFKLNMITATLIGAATSYLLGKQKFGRWGGLLTSVFYTYAPYHFLDIYIRGSVGEVWALAFFPLPFIFINRLVKRVNVNDTILLAISMALIIFSHNILSLMYMGFILTYVCMVVCVHKCNMRLGFYIGGGFLASLLLSSIFVIPALLESKYVVGLNTFTVTDHFPDLSSLLIPSWGSGYSGISVANQMSFQVGLANLLVIGIVFTSFILKRIKVEKIYILFFLIWFFVLMFLMNPASTLIWEWVPGMSYFQFPWRLLSLVILVCAVLSGSLGKIYKSRIFFIILIFISVITTYQYAHAPYFFNRSDSHYIERPNFIYGTNSIGNGFQTKWMTQQKMLPKEPLVIVSGMGGVKLMKVEPTHQIYMVHMFKSGSVQFNTAYFPGWEVYSDGEKQVLKNLSGLSGVYLKSGIQRVELRLEDTTTRKIAKMITILTGLTMLILLGLPVLQWIYGSRNR